MKRDNHFPRQKLPTKKKTKKWGRECIDAAEDLAIFRDQGVRRSYFNKRTNYNLYNDILDEADVKRATNPLGLKAGETPAKMQNYPIANPKIDRLVGEEAKMGTDFEVRVGNDSSISEKEEEKKKQLKKTIVDQIKEGADDPEEIKKTLKDEKKFLDNNFQDQRERRASHILNHLARKLELPEIFNEGFKDALIAGEEIYQADIVAGEPTLIRLNPLNVHTVRSGYSPRIEDSDIIVIDGYWSPGRVIDEYHDHLTEKQVEYIENNFVAGTSGSSDRFTIGDQWGSVRIDEMIDTAVTWGGHEFGSAFDSEGNIRVLKVYWKSRRKVKKLTYYDDFGDEQVEIVDENYKPKEDQGEKADPIWINEWWEGHKIGGNEESEAIYTRVQVRPIQFRKMENPSKCHPGIVGRAYNTNQDEAVSLMDRLKPYQYLYNIFMYRTEVAFSKSYGKIMEMPLHKIPDDWEIDKWLSYVQQMNIAVTNQFNEGNKGAAQGKLAGHMQSGQHVWDMEMGNYIQQHISTLEFIERQMGEIAGIPEQREGSVSPRESVGNVKNAIVQSSHITEYWFREHDRVKERAAQILLETAKEAYRGNNKKVQYVLDDHSTALFDIDGDRFAESDYDVFVSNSAKDQQLIEDLKELSQSMIQNDKADLSAIIDIHMSESISTIRSKIEETEEQNKEERERERQSKLEQIEKEKKLEQQNNEKDRQLKKYEADLEAQVDREKMANERLIAKLKEMAEATNKDADDAKEEMQEWEKIRQDWEKIQNEQQQMEERTQLEDRRLDIEREKVEKESNSNN